MNLVEKLPTAKSTSSIKKTNNNTTTQHIKRGKSEKLEKLKSKTISEKQGPIDWSCYGLKSKYRGELEREEAWKIWISACSYASKTLDDQMIIQPVVKIERHPFYVQYNKRINMENITCLTRTKSRLLMKRFVFDIQEIWLTNLEHLREHDPEKMFNEVTEIEDVVDDDDYRGNGVDNRRDIKAIQSLDSQIQSVSQKRSFAKAYHTAKLPSIQVMLDYESTPTPRLKNIKYIPPTIETLINGIKISPSIKNIQQIKLYTKALYPELVYFLHVDRLLPSSDFIRQGVQCEVIWRFSLYSNDNSAKPTIYIALESSVAAYAATYINDKANLNLENQPIDLSPFLLCTALVYNSTKPTHFPLIKTYQNIGSENIVAARAGTSATSSTEVAALLSVVILGFSRRSCSPTRDESDKSSIFTQFQHFNCIQDTELLSKHIENIHSIKIEICLEILHDTDNSPVQNQKFYLECSPIELRYLLSHTPAGANTEVNAFSLGDIKWWLSAQRTNDLWSYLSDHLALEYDQSSYTLVLTTNSQQRQDRSSSGYGLSKVSAEQIDGALTTLEALACAYELLETVRLDIKDDNFHSLNLFGSSQSLFYCCQDAANGDINCDEQLNLSNSSNASTVEIINPFARQSIKSGIWECVEDSGPNLSMVTSGALLTIAQVPGSFEFGRKGLWWSDQNTSPVEYTQVAVRMFRETRASSSSNSVLANMTLALDSAKRFPAMIAFENFSSYPTHYPAEEVDGVVPNLTVNPKNLLNEKLVSPIEKRISATTMIFTSIPIEGVDHIPFDSPLLPKGFKRHLPFRNIFGFRQQIHNTLLGVDPVLSTMVFGITKTGAIPNNTGVTNRNIWHNTLAITEFINRPRVPKDYQYILVKTTHQGSNEATRYTTRMKGDKMIGLTSSAFSDYEDNYNEVLRLREVFNKQIALDAKIEKVESDMKVKADSFKRQLQNKLQRELEKKVRKATKSERGWRNRLRSSTVMEVQGNWERRRDDRNGMFFFHQISATISNDNRSHQPVEVRQSYLDTCQWEVPAHWDGDPLSTDVKGGKEMANFTYPSSLQLNDQIDLNTLKTSSTYKAENCSENIDQFDMAPRRWNPNPNRYNDARLTLPTNKGAFEQPPDNWIPQINNSNIPINNNTQSNGKPKGNQHSNSDQNSEIFSLNSSIVGDKSLANSIAPTIDTANLEHIAEQLVSSDELIRVLARRLGLPESQVVPAEELSSVFSVGTNASSFNISDFRNKNPHAAPREEWADPIEEQEFDSDDDMWSDEEHEVGDFDEELEISALEDMPNSQPEAAALRRKERLIEKAKRLENAPTMPNNVPYLDLENITEKLPSMKTQLEAKEELYGWRRLPRPIIRPGFLSDALLTHTKPPDVTSSNTLNKPVFLMPISPVDACKYFPEQFVTTIESIFIPNAKKDMERSIATLERNIRREEELSRNIPTDDLLLFGEATEFTSVDTFLAKQLKEDQQQVRDPKEEAMEKAILAAKSSNIAMMEDALAEEISINTSDDFGNTLLILAAQQGSKRMCKFLLRRGANINLQSLAGNTPLHYCYAYSNHNLGMYLKAKGADDSIINVDGLTCYEGLNRESMNEMYGDDEEALMLDNSNEDSDNE